MKLLEKKDISNLCKLVINGALEQIVEWELYLIQVMNSLCDKLPLFNSFMDHAIAPAFFPRPLKRNYFLLACCYLPVFSCTALNANQKIPLPTRLHLTTLTESKENACNGNSSLGTTKVTRKHLQYGYIAGATSARPYIG